MYRNISGLEYSSDVIHSFGMDSPRHSTTSSSNSFPYLSRARRYLRGPTSRCLHFTSTWALDNRAIFLEHKSWYLWSWLLCSYGNIQNIYNIFLIAIKQSFTSILELSHFTSTWALNNRAIFLEHKSWYLWSWLLCSYGNIQNIYNIFLVAIKQSFTSILELS